VLDPTDYDAGELLSVADPTTVDAETGVSLPRVRRGSQLQRRVTGGVTRWQVARRIVSHVTDETRGRVDVDAQTSLRVPEAHADFADYDPLSDVVQHPGETPAFTTETTVMDAVDELANVFLPTAADDHPKTHRRVLDEPAVLTGGRIAIPRLDEDL
jgi:hypothetical protein